MNDEENLALKIGGVPLPYDLEHHHVLLVGQPGTGKTVAVQELLHAIRRRGDGAVIYDPTGALADTLYDPARDTIISPLDAPEVTTVEGRFIFLTDDLSRSHHARLIKQVVDEAQGQKMWLVLDELPYDVPTATIEAALAEGSGVTVIATAQSIGQIKAHGYETLWSVPRTLLFLRMGDNETAELAAREIGEK